MRALFINGSPRPSGNTALLFEAVATELRREEIEVETIQVGAQVIRGCVGCGVCARRRDERCTYDEDETNGWIQKMKHADALVLGSPVYFSGIAGTLKCFLDRAFYVASSNRGLFRHKVGAAVVAVRRSGGVTTFDQLNHYLTYAEILIPTSNYWNVGHGGGPGEAKGDLEGIQSMGVLGRNMAWLMKLVASGREAARPPERQSKTYTSFIR